MTRLLTRRGILQGTGSWRVCWHCGSFQPYSPASNPDVRRDRAHEVERISANCRISFTTLAPSRKMNVTRQESISPNPQSKHGLHN